MNNILFCCFGKELDYLSYVCIRKDLDLNYKLLLYKEVTLFGELRDLTINDYRYKFREYLKQNSIDLVIITDLWNELARHIVYCCKELDLPIILLYSNPLVDTKKKLTEDIKPKYIVCGSVYQKNKLIHSWFNLPNNIFICGYPAFDRFKQTGKNKNILTYNQFCKATRNRTKKLVIQYNSKLFSDLELFLSFKEKDIFLYLQSSFDINLQLNKNCYIDINRDIQPSNIDYYDSVYYSDLIITDQLFHLLFSMLLSKPCILIDKNNDFVDFSRLSGIDSYSTLDYSVISEKLNTKLDLSNNQLNFLLLNYFPCTFDGNNSKRFKSVIDYVLYKNKMNKELSTKFILNNLFILDPLESMRRDIIKRRRCEGKAI